MDISVVIPNYNGKNLLEKNLPKLIDCLRGYRQGKTEIIVVDDASLDGSFSFLTNFQRTQPNLKLLKNEKNSGFSSTVNKGVASARGEVVILLNSDVSPEKDFIQPLLKHFANPKVFAVGCLDKSIENNKVVFRGRGLGKWQRGFLIHRRGEVDKTDTLWVSGGSAAFRKSIWDKMGGLNTLFDPFYYEDIDLSYRALKSGYLIYFEPKSIVVHEHERGAIKSKYTLKQVKRIAYRNQFIFVWKNASDLSLKLSHLFWLPYHLFKALINLDPVFFLGFFDALILFPKVIESYSRNKVHFIKTDKEVIASLNL